MRIVRTRFLKSDIPRNPHLTGNWVVATITLVLRIVSKKDTQQTERSAWCPHEEEGEHSRHTQNNEGNYKEDYQRGAHMDYILEEQWTTAY